MNLDSSLLPAPDESVRCAAFTEQLDVDPGGTALWADEIIVADIGLPWPKPVWAMAGFAAVPEHMQKAAESGRRVRVLAAAPEEPGRASVVLHRRRDGGPFERTEHRVDDSEVGALLDTLLIDGVEASDATIVDTEPRRELLVCTQGSHDVCCGSRGPVLASAIAAARPGLSVRRVSHTGGHRFAPTALSVPDGRMWGGLDLETALAVIDRSGSPAALAPACRGWTGAPTGPGQIAERAVFAALDDWAFDDRPRTIDVAPPGDDGIVRCRVGVADEQWFVDIAPGRAVPTIACGRPGGLPAKPGREWLVVGMDDGD